MVTAPDGYARLTEREKQTLRLILRGHDAKSIARQLDLSVHTINERLRDARRKLNLSSSRAAARLVFEHEGAAPQSLVPHTIGDALPAESAAPNAPGRRMSRRAIAAIGAATMIIVLSLLALAARPEAVAPASTPAVETVDPAVEATARRFLTLVDQYRWDESYRLTGTAFQKLNSAKAWSDMSEKVRPPLGALVSRTLLGTQNLPAPPDSYEVVKFRSSFANKASAIETVTLEREAAGWRVVGVTIG